MKRRRSESFQDNIRNRLTIRTIGLSGCGTFSPDEADAVFDDGLSDDSDFDSLFDTEEDALLVSQSVDKIHRGTQGQIPALLTAPPIHGLYYDPSILLPIDLAEKLWRDCMKTYFSNEDHVNQVMLFERAKASQQEVPNGTSNIGLDRSTTSVEATASCLPSFLLDLLGVLERLLKDAVPLDVHRLLFPPNDGSGQARQVILNHYKPGEGITPHIDLLKRYGDGIIGVSLRSGTVMDFTKVSAGPNANGCAGAPNETIAKTIKSSTGRHSALCNGLVGHASEIDTDENPVSEDSPPGLCPEPYSVYLPERGIIVLKGEARYRWMHGISSRTEDLVRSEGGMSTEVIPRGERLSITFRWLLPGADVVGD